MDNFKKSLFQGTSPKSRIPVTNPTDDYDSDEEDVRGLVRIRLLSKSPSQKHIRISAQFYMCQCCSEKPKRFERLEALLWVSPCPRSAHSDIS